MNNSNVIGVVAGDALQLATQPRWGGGACGVGLRWRREISLGRLQYRMRTVTPAQSIKRSHESGRRADVIVERMLAGHWPNAVLETGSE